MQGVPPENDILCWAGFDSGLIVIRKSMSNIGRPISVLSSPPNDLTFKGIAFTGHQWRQKLTYFFGIGKD